MAQRSELIRSVPTRNSPSVYSTRLPAQKCSNPSTKAEYDRTLLQITQAKAAADSRATVPAPPLSTPPMSVASFAADDDSEIEMETVPRPVKPQNPPLTFKKVQKKVKIETYASPPWAAWALAGLAGLITVGIVVGFMMLRSIGKPDETKPDPAIAQARPENGNGEPIGTNQARRGVTRSGRGRPDVVNQEKRSLPDNTSPQSRVAPPPLVQPTPQAYPPTPQGGAPQIANSRGAQREANNETFTAQPSRTSGSGTKAEHSRNLHASRAPDISTESRSNGPLGFAE